MNNVKREVTPDFPAVGLHKKVVAFEHRLDVIEMFMYVFIEGTAEELRKKRTELENGRPLLDNEQDVARCDELIRAFTAQLHIIPHERHLRWNLRSRTV